MGKRKFLGLLWVIVAFFLILNMSCKKSSDEEEKIETYEVTVVNNSSSSYAVYIDDNYQETLKGGHYGKYKVSIHGVHYARVLQKTGYTLYPSEYKTTFVYGGSDMWI